MPSPQYNPRRQHKPVDKKPRRSGASPLRGGREPVPVPWWIWLAGGIAVGVFVSFLMKLAHAPQPPAATVSAPVAAGRIPDKNSAPAAQSKADEKAAAKAADKPEEKTAGDGQAVTKFDFYTLLPEREVIVPNEREAIKAVDRQKPRQGQPAAEAPEQLLLQVGSFRSAQEAERRRAQVAALNLEAKIESVRANGDTWYRVQAGPFTSRDQLSRARDQLSAAGVESLLLKQKPPG
jgi:cell division septation protein DedD